MIEVLPAGVMTLFPEGTRTRETAQAVVDRVMGAIRAQRAEP